MLREQVGTETGSLWKLCVARRVTVCDRGVCGSETLARRQCGEQAATSAAEAAAANVPRWLRWRRRLSMAAEEAAAAAKVAEEATAAKAAEEPTTNV